MAKHRIAYTYKQLGEITPWTARTWRWRVAQGRVRAVMESNNSVVILHKDLEAYFASLPERKAGEATAQDEKAGTK